MAHDKANTGVKERLPSVQTGFSVAPSSWPIRTATRWIYRRDRLLDALAHTLESERNFGGAFLWMPVWFGVGIAFYYALPREPLVGAFGLLALAFMALRARLNPGGFGAVAALIFTLIALGATVAQLHAVLRPTAMLGQTVVAAVNGPVEWVEQRADGSARVVLDVSKPNALIAERGGAVAAKKVRLTLRKMPEGLVVGSILQGRARVGPPPGPAYPGGYDFAFKTWFDGIGGSGFFLGAPQVAVSNTDIFSIPALRAQISLLIRAASPGESGALAAALIVGDRSGIPDDVAEALRTSGLAHILAISGLHMTLVVGTALLVLRTAMAALPTIALHYPIKKWAAGAALVVAAFYLALSGGSISAQRAFIMVAVMLLAIIFDRRALTMRNVAFAALIVLAISPHALLSPGFQMSFAAVAALIWAYEMWRGRSQTYENKPRPTRVASILGWFGTYTGGLLATALIAGLATGLFAAYHFHRIAPLGLVANLLAMPLVSLVVMPAALLSVLAMPFGLEAVPLRLMALGTDFVVDIAKSVSSAGPAGTTGLIPVQTLALASMALLILTLSRSVLRWFCIVPAVLAVLSLLAVSKPLVLIGGDGQQIGLVGDNAIRVLRPNAGKFQTDIWRRAFGDAVPEEKAAIAAFFKSTRPKSIGPAFSCDAYGCVAEHKGLTILYIKNAERLFEDCRLADIIIAPLWLNAQCADLLPTAHKTPLLINLEALNRHGSHAIYRSQDGALSVKRARDNLNRPWNIHWAKQD